MCSETIKLGLLAYNIVHEASKMDNNWQHVHFNHYKSVVADFDYSDDIGRTLLLIIDENYESINHTFERMLSLNSESPAKDFAYCALNEVPEYFPEGYTHDHFLGYCAMWVGVALQYEEYLCFHTILEATVEIIQTALTYFTLIGDFNLAEDLPKLIDVSKQVTKNLERLRNSYNYWENS